MESFVVRFTLEDGHDEDKFFCRDLVYAKRYADLHKYELGIRAKCIRIIRRNGSETETVEEFRN